MTPTSTPTGTPTGRTAGAFRHELVLHEGIGELVDLMVPFVREGADAGEHVVVLGEREFVRALLSSVPDVPRVRTLAEPAGIRYAGRDLHRARQVLERLHRTAPGVRVINQMPPVTTSGWQGWRRYEAAVNVVLAPYRAWGKCAHDRSALDPGMLADLWASHPLVQTPAGCERNPGFDGAGLPADSFVDAPLHPVEATEPTVSLLDPTAADARWTVRDLAVRCGLSPTAQECAILATAETVTNAWVHGRAPVRLRAWADEPGRLTIAVSDSGPGPHPLVGMVPEPPESLSGRGMWLVHLLLRDVHHRRDPQGYTVVFSVDGDAADQLAATAPSAG